MAFDTLSYARRLKAAGVPSEQAEAMAEATRELIASDAATKADIAEVKADIAEIRHDIATLKSDIAALRNELRNEIDQVRNEMAALEARLIAAIDTASLRLVVRLGGLIAIGIGILAAIIKL